MPVPVMSAESAVYSRSSQGYVFRTTSNQRANASIVPAQTACRICCTRAGFPCCAAHCPPGQQAWCHCEGWGGLRPRCQCY